MRSFARLLLALSLVFGVSVVPLAQAFYMASDEEVFVNYAISDDFYIAGGRVDIEGTTQGDLIVAGGDITVWGDVVQDAAIAGGRISLRGDIGDDARIAGGDVSIEGHIGDDLFASGGVIQLPTSAHVQGDAILAGGQVDIRGDVIGNLTVYGEKVFLRGTVQGDVFIEAQEITFAPSAKITGNLHYRSMRVEGDVRSAVQGEIESEQKEAASVPWDIIGLIVFLHFCFLFLFGAALYFGFPRLFHESAKVLQEQPLTCFGIGLLTVVAMPIVALLLMCTVVGIPLGIFLLFGWVFMLFFTEVAIVTVVTAFIEDRYFSKKRDAWRSLLLLALISLVCAVVTGLDFILLGFFSLGAATIVKHRIMMTLR